MIASGVLGTARLAGNSVAAIAAVRPLMSTATHAFGREAFGSHGGPMVNLIVLASPFRMLLFAFLLCAFAESLRRCVGVVRGPSRLRPPRPKPRPAVGVALATGEPVSVVVVTGMPPDGAAVPLATGVPSTAMTMH